MTLPVDGENEVSAPMSSPSNTTDRLPNLRESIGGVPVRRSVDIVAVPLRFVAFWLAVALPFLYVPLLVGGLDGEQVSAFGFLLALNAVALVVGHGYGNR